MLAYFSGTFYRKGRLCMCASVCVRGRYIHIELAQPSKKQQQKRQQFLGIMGIVVFFWKQSLHSIQLFM